MQLIYSCLTKSLARRTLVRLMQTAALAIVVGLALPARATEDREVMIRVSPAYPVLAERMKITGSVRVEVTVDAKGKVLRCQGARRKQHPDSRRRGSGAPLEI